MKRFNDDVMEIKEYLSSFMSMARKKGVYFDR